MASMQRTIKRGIAAKRAKMSRSKYFRRLRYRKDILEKQREKIEQRKMKKHHKTIEKVQRKKQGFFKRFFARIFRRKV